MNKCDFCSRGTSCAVSPYNRNNSTYNYSASKECIEATRNFTQYMIAKENNKSNKTFTKNVNVNKRTNSNKKSYNHNK